MFERHGSSRKRLVTVALMIVVLITVSLGFWYYQLPTDSDILVLDNRVLTVVLDELPGDDNEAISVAQISVSNATGVPKRAFNSYFRLMNVSRTQFQWLLVYNVTGNPDLSVFLVKRISEEEGFRLADEYIVEQVGIEYFSMHFSPRKFDVNTSTVYYTFNYPLSEKKDIELTMWVKLGTDRSVIGRHIVTTPQEVTVSLEQAMEIGLKNGLQEPRSGYPVLTGGVLCWRVVWEHTPTEEEYDAQTLYGIDVHCTTGEVMGTHRYVRPKPAPPSPIQVTQVAALIEKLELDALEDGALFQLRVLNSSDEVFGVTKTFGRMVVQEGELDNVDITLWIDRGIVVNALDSDDAIGYLREHATAGNVRVDLHKSVIMLQKKGYNRLYETLQ